MRSNNNAEQKKPIRTVVHRIFPYSDRYPIDAVVLKCKNFEMVGLVSN